MCFHSFIHSLTRTIIHPPPCLPPERSLGLSSEPTLLWFPWIQRRETRGPALGACLAEADRHPEQSALMGSPGIEPQHPWEAGGLSCGSGPRPGEGVWGTHVAEAGAEERRLWGDPRPPPLPPICLSSGSTACMQHAVGSTQRPRCWHLLGWDVGAPAGSGCGVHDL